VLTICATLVLVAGMAVVWVRVVQTLTAPATGPKTIGQPDALTWDGRVFTSPAQLKSFFTARGRSYSRWAARHPTAFGGTAPAKSTAKHATSTKKTTKPKVVHHVAAPPVSTTKSRPLTSMVLTVLLLVAGLVLGGSAVLPVRYAPEAVARFYAESDRRLVALAAATAILLGFGVSFYLT
jgi:hypothetical protein